MQEGRVVAKASKTEVTSAVIALVAAAKAVALEAMMHEIYITQGTRSPTILGYHQISK